MTTCTSSIGPSMQTFVPDIDPYIIAAMLDTKRLGKQIIECRQIGKAIANPGYGWQHHPAVAMWRNSPGGLLVYATYMNAEWEGRRGKTHGAYTNMLLDYGRSYAEAQVAALRWEEHFPSWWGRDDVILSHRSNLLRKDPEHYEHYFTGRDDLPYVWPKDTE